MDDYNGKLVTLRIKDKEALLTISLFDIEGTIDDKGLLLRYKESKKEIGYFEDICGLDFKCMMKVLGYEEI